MIEMYINGLRRVVDDMVGDEITTLRLRVKALEADRSMLHRLIKRMRAGEEEVLADVFAEVDELMKGGG